MRPITPSMLTMACVAALLIAPGCGGGGGEPDASSSGGTEERAATPRAGSDPAVDPKLAQAGVTALDLAGPAEPPIDQFHPEGSEDVRPALGGRVIQHIASEPPNLNASIESSAVITWVLREIHGGLLRFNKSTWAYEPDLATGYDLEDTLILDGGRGDGNTNVVFGKVEESGDHYVVTSGSPNNPMERREVPRSEVASLERGTVFTFHLRDGILWHDGHGLDIDDVMFSFELFRNPHVDCETSRFVFDDIVHAEVVGERSIRFFFREQYFGAERVFDMTTLCLLPRHLYDLLDPDNPDHRPDATDEERGTYINDNPRNNDFVGLGPYRLTVWERGRYLEAEKFDGYYDKDPEKSGYLDVLRWTHVDDDNLAFQALLNGEVDIFDRVKSDDFLGAATKSDLFTQNFYKAFTYTGNLGYVGWNMYRDKLSDVRVRTALAHSFDVHDWIRTNYEGLALVATGTQFRFGPGYNRDVEPYNYDVERAHELLAEAGWLDRDGNGIVDKDGEDLVIEALMPSGNKASEKLLQKMQESFETIGVKLTIQQMEWATFLERILERDFDACNLAWVLNDVESDPKGLWHSDEAVPDRRTSNHSGYADAVSDSLIEAGRRELDPETRHQIWKELHLRIYEAQPYLFGWNVPRKIAFSRKIRGVKLYKFAPGYELRDLYYPEGTPGTRPLDPS